MPAWLGVALAACFALVAGHRAARKDVPGALMAAGMAVMSFGMAGLGPTMLHGPGWALAFVLVAVWPLLHPLIIRWRPGRVCGGPLAHLLGGAAMVYMCLLPMHHGATDTAVTVTAMHGHSGMAGMSGPMTVAGPTSTPLALIGWALACYFLLGTITALTRRSPSGARARWLPEAFMGFGTVIMLVAMT
ncbi:DUF5134 domain-containing protein [Pseudonocardia spinosispora]|uniref:DUF5134 domain-containing protein n=1 Tax=Pseudonocardia spinosispora TaxID=103441 RepID=UPI0009FC4247|nr:DUF5134 domain-containing protein [Pseudonocardia spinosispora]